jgi:hypothetical protein
MSGNNTEKMRRQDDMIMKDVQQQQAEIIGLLKSHDEKLSKLVVGMYGVPENGQKGVIAIMQDHEQRLVAMEDKSKDFPFEPLRNGWTSIRTILAVMSALGITVMTIIALVVERVFAKIP